MKRQSFWRISIFIEESLQFACLENVFSRVGRRSAHPTATGLIVSHSRCLATHVRKPSPSPAGMVFLHKCPIWNGRQRACVRLPSHSLAHDAGGEKVHFRLISREFPGRADFLNFSQSRLRPNGAMCGKPWCLGHPEYPARGNLVPSRQSIARPSYATGV